ncbi:MAG: RTX toxin, partial [Myxococcota bacterium]
MFIAQKVQTGSSHSCAESQGQIKCWGNNIYGQLGVGNRQQFDGIQQKPVDLQGQNVLQLSSQGQHVCVLLEDHTLRCWGSNFHG